MLAQKVPNLSNPNYLLISLWHSVWMAAPKDSCWKTTTQQDYKVRDDNWTSSELIQFLFVISFFILSFSKLSSYVKKLLKTKLSFYPTWLDIYLSTMILNCRSNFVATLVIEKYGWCSRSYLLPSNYNKLKNLQVVGGCNCNCP